MLYIGSEFRYNFLSKHEKLILGHGKTMKLEILEKKLTWQNDSFRLTRKK